MLSRDWHVFTTEVDFVEVKSLFQSKFRKELVKIYYCIHSTQQGLSINNNEVYENQLRNFEINIAAEFIAALCSFEPTILKCPSQQFLGRYATLPLRALRDIPKTAAKETNNITT